MSEWYKAAINSRATVYKKVGDMVIGFYVSNMGENHTSYTLL